MLIDLKNNNILKQIKKSFYKIQDKTMTTDSPKRHYTTPKKLKLMIPEELKAHKHELYKRHYEANKDKIGEKQKKLYQTSNNFREEKLINNYKNFYKLTNDEIALFNHC